MTRVINFNVIDLTSKFSCFFLQVWSQTITSMSEWVTFHVSILLPSLNSHHHPPDYENKTAFFECTCAIIVLISVVFFLLPYGSGVADLLLQRVQPFTLAALGLGVLAVPSPRLLGDGILDTTPGGMTYRAASHLPLKYEKIIYIYTYVIFEY